MRVFLLFSEYNQHVVLRLKVHGYDQTNAGHAFAPFTCCQWIYTPF